MSYHQVGDSSSVALSRSTYVENCRRHEHDSYNSLWASSEIDKSFSFVYALFNNRKECVELSINLTSNESFEGNASYSQKDYRLKKKSMYQNVLMDNGNYQKPRSVTVESATNPTLQQKPFEIRGQAENNANLMTV